MQEKIDLSIGIVAWKSGRVLENTLKSYKKAGMFELVDDIVILFQEFSQRDKRIALKYKVKYIAEKENIGIGKAFEKLTYNASKENILLLEHDWKLIEPMDVVINQLNDGIKLLNEGFHCIRYRHRVNYGYPHYSVIRYKAGEELAFYDKWIDLFHPHLLDSIHWQASPDKLWPDKIHKNGNMFTSDSRYANWTNNPCMYKKYFYLQTVKPFVGKGISLEENISYWWARQGFKVAHGNGLFKHNDEKKYPSNLINKFVNKMEKTLNM